MRKLTYLAIGTTSVAIIVAGVFGFKIIKETYTAATSKKSYNIILIVSDQQAYHLQQATGYILPGHQELKKHGVTFTNHYTAAAMCSPSRAAFLTGTAPQVNGVFDQMEYPFTPTLNPKQANMGSVLKGLGYRTAYFGKFEMDKNLLSVNAGVNTSELIKPYGFDEFNPDGDTGGGSPRQGYNEDPYFVGEAIRWLHTNATGNANDKPFFMVVSLLNPHDIMYADANVPGTPADQQALLPVIMPPPATAFYAKQWQFELPKSLKESLDAKDIPRALMEYQQGWAGTFGFIPTARTDMWGNFYNYYLNAIRDDDRQLQLLTDTMTDLDLWKNTIVIFTADHGEMGGAHGGLRGKGPMAYEENSHVPLIIDHPEGAKGASCHALTSHLDLLPTLVGFAGKQSDAIKNLAGNDFSDLLNNPEQADVHAVRPAALFNYVGLSTIDSAYTKKLLQANIGHKPPFPSIKEINYAKRGFLTFVFDGRYKFARYYAPNAFNTPNTLDELFKNNDVQLFDLKNDPQEMNNLARQPEKYKEEILRMNELLNTMMAREVGVNGGGFLPK